MFPSFSRARGGDGSSNGRGSTHGSSEDPSSKLVVAKVLGNLDPEEEVAESSEASEEDEEDPTTFSSRMSKKMETKKNTNQKLRGICLKITSRNITRKRKQKKK